MNPLLIAAGVLISARIISLISGELTEADKEKQLEIEKRIEEIRRDALMREPAFNQAESDESPNHRVQKSPSALYEFLLDEEKKQQEDTKQLIGELKTTKNAAIRTLRGDKSVLTPLRKSSLELLIRQLEELREKCYAYLGYLSAYENQINKNKYSDDISAFAMRLPNEYPYVGKVLWIDTDDISNEALYYQLPLVSFQIKMTDYSSDDLQAHSCHPVMVTRVDYKRSVIEASFELGAFKAYELTNPHLGVKATVKKIFRNHIILVYQDRLEMKLEKGKLINPHRFPPLHSTITVYPIVWEYTLKPFRHKDGSEGAPVTVSELKKDAISVFPLKSVPICFSRDDLHIFRSFFESQDHLDYKGEFLIGLPDDNWLGLKDGVKLKLQLGDTPLFFVQIVANEVSGEKARFIFRFDHLCSSEEKPFTADDVYIPFDYGFTPYYEGTSDELIMQYTGIEAVDDVSSLIWQICEELRIQDQIRKERNGASYFFKWESLTSQLISVLEQGDFVEAEVDWLPSGKNGVLTANIINYDDILLFVQKFSKKADKVLGHEWTPQFFVKDTEENRYPTKLFNNGKNLNIYGFNAINSFGNHPKTIELYAVNIPYAEQQQKDALRRFRTGQVVNPFIQAACLNSASIKSNYSSSISINHFFNNCIKNNEAQQQVINCALREQNIYLIQGPPGTGKTTVIREMIEQAINLFPMCRILIVSQANVAVDNALSGLVEKYSGQIVRCGNGSKISPQLQPLQLQHRCQEYLNDLSLRKSNFDAEFYQDWERLIIPHDNSDFSPVLCELVVRSHQIIGATCVGLSKKRIGLERAEFDLVIIDEAGKALPAELLIPLLRAKKAIIIGDQKQLPPVINPILYDAEQIELEERSVSEKDLFERSFFERLYCYAPSDCKSILDTQYRMPAVIGTAISELFYDGILKNAAETEKRIPVLFPSNLTFINYAHNRDYHERKDAAKQLTNEIEAIDVFNLVMSIREKDPKCSIAVITPYRGQKRLISNTFLTNGYNYRTEGISIDTIDAFQGSEADVVVFCTTRAKTPTLFFRDSRRINVALSRTKRELIIMGNLDYFYDFSRSDSCLPALADYIKAHGAIICAGECDALSEHTQVKKTSEMLISIDALFLPPDYYLNTVSKEAVQLKMDEYYANGDFLAPLPVKRVSNGIALAGNYEQFCAAQELSLSECRCIFHS